MVYVFDRVHGSKVLNGIHGGSEIATMPSLSGREAMRE